MTEYTHEEARVDDLCDRIKEGIYGDDRMTSKERDDAFDALDTLRAERDELATAFVRLWEAGNNALSFMEREHYDGSDYYTALETSRELYDRIREEATCSTTFPTSRSGSSPSESQSASSLEPSETGCSFTSESPAPTVPAEWPQDASLDRECEACHHFLTPWKCNGGTETDPCPRMTPPVSCEEVRDALRITGPDEDGAYWLHATSPSGNRAGWQLVGAGTPIGRKVLDELSAALTSPQPPSEVAEALDGLRSMEDDLALGGQDAVLQRTMPSVAQSLRDVAVEIHGYRTTLTRALTQSRDAGWDKVTIDALQELVCPTATDPAGRKCERDAERVAAYRLVFAEAIRHDASDWWAFVQGAYADSDDAMTEGANALAAAVRLIRADLDPTGGE